MSRTHRRIAPNREYLKEDWYKYQEDRRLGKGVWWKAAIKNRHSSNRVKVRIAAQRQQELAEKHNRVDRAT